MKTSHYTLLVSRSLLGLLALTLLAACQPPNGKPKQEHQGAIKEWSPTQTPKDVTVEAKDFESYDLNHGTELLADPKADLMKGLLQPLAGFVLNAKFLDDVNFRTKRMTLMVNQFMDGFLRQLNAKNNTAEFKTLKKRFTDTVTAGCTRDLKRDCRNVSLFRADGRFSKVMTLLAMEFDAPIKAELEAHGLSNAECIKESEVCRTAVEERYRFLALALDRKANRQKDSDFSLAYLKYAMLFSVWLNNTPEDDDSFSGSYLRQTHTSIFDILIADFHPNELNGADVREFTRNFNGWKYSVKSSGNTPGFERGIKEMIRISTECCLYTDASKTKIDPSVTAAIIDAQNGPDDIKYGPTFLKMLNEIPEKLRNDMFNNLDPVLAAKLPSMIKLEADKPNAFYNEMFFVIDRLYREDLDQATIDMIFGRLNMDRAKSEMPVMIADYIKATMIYRIYRTNKFMNELFNSNLGSSEVLQEVLARSLNTATAWTDFQTQASALSLAMERHLSKREFRTEADEYGKTKTMVDAINRNIHYLSIYPGMFILNYFATKSNGTVTIRTPFGSFDLSAEFALEKFLEGKAMDTEVGTIWLRFARELLAFTRHNLLYGWYYLLNTKTLDMFQDQSQLTDVNSTPEERTKTSRTRYLETIFNKYLKRQLEDLQGQIRSYENSTTKAQGFSTAEDICNYELNAPGAPTRAPNVRINFTELDSRTYTGSTLLGLSKIIQSFTNDAGQGFKILNTNEVRVRYARVLLRMLEDDLIKSEQITAYGQPHADTKQLRALLDGIDAGRLKLTKLFLDKRQHYFDCGIKLRMIEKRRALHLYETERAWLDATYTRMEESGVLSMSTEEIRDKQDELRAKLFPGSKFDRIEGTTYNLSKFDLMMRMKREIERPDFHANEVDDEFKKARNVTVFIDEEALKTNPMVTGPTSMPVQAGTGRAKFIEQGMQSLNGRSGSFINWESSLGSTDSFRGYFSTLLTMYMLGPVKDGDQTLQITVDHIKHDFLAHLQLFTLDDRDQAKAIEFKSDGLATRDKFRDSTLSYTNLVQKDGSTPRPLYYSLALNMYDMGQLRTQSRSYSDDVSLFIDAVTMAKGFNNQGAFVFAPPAGIEDAVRAAYGDAVRDRVNRLTAFYDDLENDQATKTIGELAPGMLRPIFMDGDTPVYWSLDNSKNIADAAVRDSYDDFVRSLMVDAGGFFRLKGQIKEPK